MRRCLRACISAAAQQAPASKGRRMVMCAPYCTCRHCVITAMSLHPAFRDRVDQMIHEYKRLLYGPSYFPIELVEGTAIDMWGGDSDKLERV